ncbi:hypothetical protein Taro_036517 [Colocasia esculenta]|uniref:Uncharacterized protein n=1 Tax=Colocasia esculenta TaxID=4460 RepID=A0A843WLW5_COLES|nr:hypothetical protein [Colocasia esculenta]
MAVKLSLGSPKKPPKHHSSGFLVGVDAKPVVGKPSPWSPLASSCNRTPDEAPNRRIKACKVQTSSQPARVFSPLAKRAKREPWGCKERDMRRQDPSSKQQQNQKQSSHVNTTCAGMCCGQMTRGNIKITTSQKTSKKMILL